MEVHPLLHQLDSLLAGEEVRGRLSPGAGGGISPGMRDGSSHVLRCLKVWVSKLQGEVVEHQARDDHSLCEED